MGEAHSVRAFSAVFLFSILSVSVISNPWVIGRAPKGLEFTGCVDSLSNLVWCLAVLIRSRRRSHICRKSESMSLNRFLVRAVIVSCVSFSFPAMYKAFAVLALYVGVSIHLQGAAGRRFV